MRTLLASVFFASLFVVFMPIYTQTESLDLLSISDDPSSEETRGVIQDINEVKDTIDRVEDRVRNIGRKLKIVNCNVDDIEGDVKDLLNVTDIIQEKVCDVESSIDDLEVFICSKIDAAIESIVERLQT